MSGQPSPVKSYVKFTMSGVELGARVVDAIESIDAPLGIRRTQVVERTGDDIEHAIVIDVGRRSRPSVIHRADWVRREAVRELLLRQNDAIDVFPRDVLESHVACAADVKGERAVAGRRRVGHDATDAWRRTYRIRPEVDPNRIPLTAFERGGRRGRDGILRGRRRADALAGRLAAVSRERQSIGHEIAVRERHVHAAHAAVGRFLRPQQHARLARRVAAHVRVEEHVLERLVHHEPAARVRFGPADDFAVFRLPFSLPDRLPSGERRTGERGVRLKVRRIRRMHAESRRGAQRDRECANACHSVASAHRVLLSVGGESPPVVP